MGWYENAAMTHAGTAKPQKFVARGLGAATHYDGTVVSTPPRTDRCANGCGTRLSRYNTGIVCAVCA